MLLVFFYIPEVCVVVSAVADNCSPYFENIWPLHVCESISSDLFQIIFLDYLAQCRCSEISTIVAQDITTAQFAAQIQHTRR